MDVPYDKKRKLTLLVHDSLIDRVRGAVEAGHAASQSAFVEEAVTEYLLGLDREELRREYSVAAKDPLFLADVDQMMRDFEVSDDEVEPS